MVGPVVEAVSEWFGEDGTLLPLGVAYLVALSIGLLAGVPVILGG